MEKLRRGLQFIAGGTNVLQREFKVQIQSKTKGVVRPSVVTEESTMAMFESLEDEARQAASHRTKF